MKTATFKRRALLVGTGATIASCSTNLISPATAQGTYAPTKTMRGGSNNYVPNAPIVESLGKGFLMSGVVRKAETGEPLSGVRIQIWAATTLGGEQERRNHGSVMTMADGSYQLEMPQIVPNFGQPHAHLAYDDAEFQTVFLRPLMSSASDTSLQADFILAPA